MTIHKIMPCVIKLSLSRISICLTGFLSRCAIVMFLISLRSEGAVEGKRERVYPRPGPGGGDGVAEYALPDTVTRGGILVGERPG